MDKFNESDCDAKFMVLDDMTVIPYNSIENQYDYEIKYPSFEVEDIHNNEEGLDGMSQMDSDQENGAIKLLVKVKPTCQLNKNWLVGVLFIYLLIGGST